MLGRLAQLLGFRGAVAPLRVEVSQKSEADAAEALIPPPVPGSQKDDRRKVESPNSLPPAFADFAERYSIMRLVGRVREGHAAIGEGDRERWTGILGTLDGAQRNLLRDLLINKPPHPDLKSLRGHPATKGPATVVGLISILDGQAFGWPGREGPAPATRVEEAMAFLGHHLDAQTCEGWRAVLAESEKLTGLVLRLGPFALRLIEAFDAPFAERIETEFSAVRVLGDVATDSPELLSAFRAERDRVGDRILFQALERLDSSASLLGLSAVNLLRTFGVEAALRFAIVLARDEHAARALRSSIGVAGMIELGRRDVDQLAQALVRAGEGVASFGPDGTPLRRGAHWPAPTEQTPGIAKTEAEILAPLGLSVDDLANPQHLDVQAVSAVIGALRKDLADRGQARLESLDREVMGRRFVSFRYYDALYSDGVQNPEHRYSIKTFESWSRAATEVRRSADVTRGRPLEPGELTDLMCRLHRLAASGMVAIHESGIGPDDLGRLRSRTEDHVQLGNGLHHVDENLDKLLDQNPFLQRLEGYRKKIGTVVRSIVFSRGPDVPKMVADLDLWVRQNEEKMPPLELAAAVHHRLVSIHPFMDGNGRTSKLIVDFLLDRAGIEPPIWREGEVLKDMDRWPKIIESGVRFHLSTVLRHWRSAVASEGTPS